MSIHYAEAVEFASAADASGAVMEADYSSARTLLFATTAAGPGPQQLPVHGMFGFGSLGPIAPAIGTDAVVGRVGTANIASLSVAASTVVGRTSSSDLSAVSMANLRTMLGLVSAYKTSNQTKNSDTTFADDTALAGLTLPVGVYNIYGNVVHGGNSTADIKFQWTFSGTATLEISMRSTLNLVAVDNGLANWVAFSASEVIACSNAGTQEGRVIGYINVTVAGDLDLQWAQSVSNAGGTIVYAGSFLQLVQM